MPRNPLHLLVVSLLLVTSALACGKDEEPSTEPTAAPSEPPATEEDEAETDEGEPSDEEEKPADEAAEEESGDEAEGEEPGDEEPATKPTRDDVRARLDRRRPPPIIKGRPAGDDEAEAEDEGDPEDEPEDEGEDEAKPEDKGEDEAEPEAKEEDPAAAAKGDKPKDDEPKARPPPIHRDARDRPRPRGPTLAADTLMPLATVTDIVNAKGFVDVGVLPGIAIGPGYSSIQYRAPKGNDFGVALQVWKDPARREADDRFRRMRLQYPNAEDVRVMPAKAFFAHFNGIQMLTFVDSVKRVVATVACGDKVCDHDQLTKLAKAVRGKL